MAHKFLLLCGAALVILRFVPSEPGGYLSRLFFDQAVHNRISDVGMQIFMSLGVTGEQYQSQVAGLASLSHAAALIIEALGIAVIVYIITRWI